MWGKRLYRRPRRACTARGATRLTSPRGKKVFIAPRSGRQEPSTHRAKVLFFDELADLTKPYAQLHAHLSRFMTNERRNNALYYDAVRDLLPQQRYNDVDVWVQWRAVRQFCREVWRDIR